jgi:hypothetical protein
MQTMWLSSLFEHITNLWASWVHSKLVQILLFYRFVLFKHECHALFKHEKWFLCVNNMNKHTTFGLKNINKHMAFVFKQCAWHWCSNNIGIQMASMSIPYELMKSRFHIILIAKLWSILFVNALVFHRWNPLSYVMTIKVVYLYQKTQYFMLATISRFIIIWCKNILNFFFIKLVYYNTKNMVTNTNQGIFC